MLSGETKTRNGAYVTLSFDTVKLMESEVDRAKALRHFVSGIRSDLQEKDHPSGALMTTLAALPSAMTNRNGAIFAGMVVPE